jgi:uncharacterized Zn-finger protein
MSEPIRAEHKSEVVFTAQPRVACDGPVDGKHPRVFLTLTHEGYVVCPYCSKVFRQAQHHS